MNQGNKQVQELTKEELQKTQVLNLKEFVETVHFEKITSKKPAIAMAFVGILLILFGTSFQIAKSLNAAKKPAVEPRSAQVQEPIEEKPVESNLTCQTNIDNQDGTQVTYTVIYNLEDEKLIGYIKTYDVTVPDGSEQGNASLQKYITELQALTYTDEGYRIENSSKNNGVVTTITADYLKMDLSQFPPENQNHFLAKVDFPLDTTYQVLYNTMTSYGYICN